MTAGTTQAWTRRIAIGAGAGAILFLALAAYPKAWEWSASSTCSAEARGYDGCSTCCSKHGMSMSARSSDPSEPSCQCFLTSRDSIFARPLFGGASKPPTRVYATASDEDDTGLGQPCEKPDACGPNP
jgi:hypothetical protein